MIRGAWRSCIGSLSKARPRPAPREQVQVHGKVQRSGLATFVTLALLSLSLLLNASCAGVMRGLENHSTRKWARAGVEVARFSPAKSVHVRYYEGGRGPAVVLLHGFGGSAIWQWRAQVLELVASHRVIVPDLLWFGQSHGDPQDISLAAQVEMVETLIEDLRLGSVTVVGSSYGGIVAAQLARRRPELVQKLILTNSPGYVYSASELAALEQRFGIEHVEDLLVPRRSDDVARILEMAYHEPPAVPKMFLRAIFEVLYLPTGCQQRQLLRQLVRDMQVLMSDAAHYTGSVELIWGQYDRVFPLELGQKIAEQLGARIQVIENTGHAPNIERPAAFNAALVRALSG